MLFTIMEYVYVYYKTYGKIANNNDVVILPIILGTELFIWAQYCSAADYLYSFFVLLI